jgi:hypothetical protein
MKAGKVNYELPEYLASKVIGKIKAQHQFLG